MSQVRARAIDMIHGPLYKNIWIYSVPLMITTLLQMLFNAADTVIVGRFAGEQALAAVGATGSLCFLIVSLFNGLSIGSNVLIARYLGAQDHEEIEKSVHTSMMMAVYSGLFLTVAGFFLSRPMLRLMATPADIIDQSELYMRIYFVGTFFMMLYNFGSAILRAKGDTRRPLIFLFISGGTNVALNLVFVVFFHMDVAGVAWATVISQAVSALLVCIALVRDTDETHLDWHKLAVDWQEAWEIIRIGVPAGIQNMVFSLSNVVVQSSINSFGSSAIVAGNSAGANIESFAYVGMAAFNQACMTFTSQNVGAGNYKRIKDVFKASMLLDIVFTTVLGVAVWWFGEFLLGFYTTEAAVIAVGMQRLLWVAAFLVINGILEIFAAAMRGMGYSSMPALLMIVGICGVRLSWLWIIFPIFRTLECIYLCYPISWTVASIILGFAWVKCYRDLMARVGGGE